MMTGDEIKNTVLRAFGGIAPEADPIQIKPQVRFRDKLDIDSIGFLNFAIGLNNKPGAEVPEADYPKVASWIAASNM